MPKNNTTPTYEQLINKAIRRLMLTITLLVSLITLLMVGTQQTINTTREARDLMSSLNQANQRRPQFYSMEQYDDTQYETTGIYPGNHQESNLDDRH